MSLTAPWAERDSAQAEVRRLRREAGDQLALERMQADPGPGAADRARTFTRSQLPGVNRLRLLSDGVSIWYTVTPYEGQEVITIQYVRPTPDLVGITARAACDLAPLRNRTVRLLPTMGKLDLLLSRHAAAWSAELATHWAQTAVEI